jgi:potassium large conductance calcium-activated channel subfamily M alpha protein 1
VLGLLLLVRLLYLRRERHAGRAVTLRSAVIARHVVSLKSLVGKILAAVGMVFSLGSFIIYVRETIKTSESPFLVERCGVYKDDWFIADAIFNLYFLVYFILRFLAATDKLVFWIRFSTIIDFATVPPIIVSLGFDQLWIGLIFVSATYIQCCMSSAFVPL